MLDDNSTTSVLHDPLLAFVAANRGSATSAHIRTVTLFGFTPDQVLVAKNLLWGVNIAARHLGENPKRVTRQARTASEAHLSDVLEALRKLDNANQLPRIAVYASDLHLVSRVRAGDIDVVSLAERLQDVESALQDLQSPRERISTASPAPNVRAFVNHKDCKVVALHKVSHDNAPSQSFCLTEISESSASTIATLSSRATMKLRVASLNSKGLGAGKIDYIESLFNSHDLVLLQEHWQLQEQLVVFNTIQGVACHGASAMDSSRLILGRPYGGVAILWRSALCICFSPVPCNSQRICAVKASSTTGEHLFLVINVYMPTDSAANLQEYDDVLRELSTLLETNGNDRVILGERVGSDLHIKFNAAKSQLLLFNPGQHREVSPVYFSGAFVSQSMEAVHLGHLISPDIKLPPIRSAEDLTRRTNILASRFGHCGLEVKYRLFRAHCMSAYGSSLWNLQDAAPYFCAWRKCLRRLLHLPRTTHRHLLPPLVHDFYPDYQIHRRSMHFMSACCTSGNAIVQRRFKEIIIGSRSAVSDSLTIMCAKYNLDRENLPTSLKKPIAEPNRTAAALRDFMLLREETGDF
ncbi:hypothetical protein CAPTEDRAFT_209107 [Capitella teleta]|uniref:Endonuclease/exonuclease/phosphatase domain-containing protein n=1 Tax=Capitella teleta TaxID=283909 RepID=R7UKV6_CAPTE|nr:hypothetical protein CAPTEDRAFT_209107 [Capitella teleta]|eukprot:ELU06733.1 hypothetical protein CAPTEDRAFT_209107 [Capitella teleta]